MKIGIGLPNQVRDVRADLIPGWASEAEKAGFSSLGTVGRIAYPGVMDTVTLAAAAGATSTIGLVSGVLLAPVWPAALLAKELAGIDGVSGGRLTLGVGVGNDGGRADDFVVDGLTPANRGKRLDADLEIFQSVWRGEPVGGGPNAAVPAGTREVPMLFGGFAPAPLKRLARWGVGYVGASVPAAMVATSYEAAKVAWQEAGREGRPKLVAVAYYAFGDADAGRANVRDYYSAGGAEMADMMASGVHVGTDGVKAAIASFEEIGADELILNPTTASMDQLSQLAEAVL